MGAACGCGAEKEVIPPEPIKVPFALKAKLTKEQKLEARQKKVAEIQANMKGGITNLLDEDCVLDEELKLDTKLQGKLRALVLEMLCVAEGGLMQTEICKLFQNNGAGNISSARALWNLMKPDLTGLEESEKGVYSLNATSREMYTISEGVSGTKAAETHRRLALVLLELADPRGDASWKARFREGEKQVDLWNHLASWLPYHLTYAGMKAELTKVLTDIPFLEERCRLGVINLLNDYLTARKLGIGSEFGSPVNDFFTLFRDNVEHLILYPEHVFQLAFNYPHGTEPQLTAGRLLSEMKERRAFRTVENVSQTREWAIRWANSPARSTAVSRMHHTESIESASYSPDNELVATAHGAWCFVWDVRNLLNVRNWRHKPVRSWHCGAEITCLAFSLDSKVIYTGGADSNIRAWETNSGRPDQSGPSEILHGRVKTMEELEAEEAARKKAAKKNKKNKRGGKAKPPAGWFQQEEQNALGRTASQLMAGGRTAAISAIRTTDGDEGPILIVPERPDMKVNALTVGTKAIASVGDDGVVCLWHPTTRVRLGCLEGHTAAITAVRFDVGENIVASASDDLSIRYWSAPIAFAREEQRCSQERMENAVNHEATANEKMKQMETDQAEFTKELEDTETRMKSPVMQEEKNRVKLFEDQSGAMSLRSKIRRLGESMESFEDDVLAAEEAAEAAKVDLEEKTNAAETMCETEATMLTIADAHQKRINCIAFSPDGLAMVSCSEDTSIKIWSRENQALTGTIGACHKSAVTSVNFNHDSSRMVSSSNDKTLVLWDMEIMVIVRTLTGHTERINHAQFSNDGSYLLSCSEDKTAQLWDMALDPEVLPPAKSISRKNYESYKDKIRAKNARLRAKLLGKYLQVEDVDTEFTDYGATGGHGGTVMQLSLPKSGDMMASCSADHTLKIWNTAANQIRQTFTGHTDSVNCAHWTSDEMCVVSGSSDRTIRIWDVLPNTCKATLSGHKGEINCIQVDDGGAGGRVIASGSDDFTTRIWHWKTVLDATNGMPDAICKTFKHELVHNGPVVCLQFSPDGKTLATGSTDYSAKVWNYRKGSQLLHLELDGYQEPVTTLCYHPDGSTLACAMQDRTIKFWDTSCGQAGESLGDLHREIKHKKPITCMAYSVDQTELVSTSKDCSLVYWDVAGNIGKRSVRGNFAPMQCVVFHPRDEGIMLIASGSEIFTLTRTKDTSVPNINSYFRQDHEEPINAKKKPEKPKPKAWWMDINQDGVVDLGEFIAGGGLKKDFVKFDLNGDGVLDGDELDKRADQIEAEQLEDDAQ